MGSIRKLKAQRKKEEQISSSAADEMVREGGQQEREFDFAEDDIELIADARRGGKKVVSLNPNLGRIVLYRATFETMAKEYGKEFENVQVFLVDKYPGYFWIRPCDDEAKGAKKLHKTGETRLISAKMLLHKLGKKKGNTIQYDARWDAPHKALVVDITKPTE